MHPILTKWLHQNKIASVDELDKDEKAVYDNYDKVLSKEPLTLEDLKVFISQQVELIERKWRDYDRDELKKSDLIPYHTCYKTLLAAIESPSVEREAMINHLTQLTQ